MLLVITKFVMHPVAFKRLLQHTYVSVKCRGDRQACCTASSAVVLLVNSECMDLLVLMKPCILYSYLCVFIVHKLLRDLQSVFGCVMSIAFFVLVGESNAYSIK